VVYLRLGSIWKSKKYPCSARWRDDGRSTAKDFFIFFGFAAPFFAALRIILVAKKEKCGIKILHLFLLAYLQSRCFAFSFGLAGCNAEWGGQNLFDENICTVGLGAVWIKKVRSV